jgi:predicted Fe-S protein YdhL (DUF1289 family)
MRKAKTEDDDDVKSPCKKKCSLNKKAICPTCFRSIDEITSWPDVDNATRRTILEAVALRRRRVKE